MKKKKSLTTIDFRKINIVSLKNKVVCQNAN